MIFSQIIMMKTVGESKEKKIWDNLTLCHTFFLIDVTMRLSLIISRISRQIAKIIHFRCTKNISERGFGIKLRNDDMATLYYPLLPYLSQVFSSFFFLPAYYVENITRDLRKKKILAPRYWPCSVRTALIGFRMISRA